jgi:hypothetical protein
MAMSIWSPLREDLRVVTAVSTDIVSMAACFPHFLGHSIVLVAFNIHYILGIGPALVLKRLTAAVLLCFIFVFVNIVSSRASIRNHLNK